MVLRSVTASLFIAALTACGGGGGSATPPVTPTLTVTGTAATGLAIAGATVTGKCKVGTGTSTTLANGTFTLTVIDGQLPCILQITNPAEGTKLHTLVSGTSATAVANITPLTEMTTARVLGSEPNVFFAAFDAAAAAQKVTATNIASAQTAVGLVLAGTIDTTTIGDFITKPLVAATQGSTTTGDAQDKLLDALKLKLTTAQLGTVTTALASNQTTDAIKQTVLSLTTSLSAPPVAKVGTAQSVVAGSIVTLDASTSTAATGKILTFAWTVISKPAGSAATLAAPTTAKPTFVADVAGEYVASVIVNDGTTASSAVAVTVTASVANAAPVANAGITQNVVAGSVVTLDGSTSSDANGDTLTYVWTLPAKPAGSTASLSSTNSVKPTFTADIAGTYVASLMVNDGKMNSSSVVVSILATASAPAISELPTIPFATLPGDNQHIGVATDDTIYLVRQVIIDPSAIRSEFAGRLFLLPALTNSWIEANVPKVSTPTAIHPWGIIKAVLPKLPDGVVYVEQLYQQCRSIVSSTTFTCQDTTNYLPGSTWFYSDYLGDVSAQALASDESSALSPVDQNTALLGTNSGEIKRTVDRGATFTTVQAYNGLQSVIGYDRRIRTVVYSPANASTVWASGAGGILKSTDAGLTWSSVFSVFGTERMAIDSSGRYLVALKSGGLIYSVDGGTTWNTVSGDFGYTIAASNTQSGNFYSAAQNKIFKIRF